ncbi:MAG TPA: GNAT family N-acetyltransferase [Rhizomicrobium sp.]|jgi:GNAT superfamily N-acetyltransferase|nr:GNAT family N-acetyltransferase [Rhizomicrobium sp.]
MTQKLQIRPAARGDEGLILAFVRELAQYERALDAVEATTAQLASVLFGANPRAFCDIAQWDGAPAGFAVWFYNFSTWRGRHGIYLEDLFVKPELRGHGIGKALLVHLAKRAVAEGCGRFEWAVLNWNTPSIDFYKSLGAEPMAEWTGYRLSGAALEKLAST